MYTEEYECGCKITYSMFGDKEVISAELCEEHKKEYPTVLEMTARIIREIHA